MAGTQFGDVAVSLFAAHTVFREILGDCRSTTCRVFPYQMPCRGGQVGPANRRVQFCNFMVGYARIMFGSWLNRPPL